MDPPQRPKPSPAPPGQPAAGSSRTPSKEPRPGGTTRSPRSSDSRDPIPSGRVRHDERGMQYGIGSRKPDATRSRAPRGCSRSWSCPSSRSRTRKTRTFASNPSAIRAADMTPTTNRRSRAALRPGKEDSRAAERPSEGDPDAQEGKRQAHRRCARLPTQPSEPHQGARLRGRGQLIP